MTRRDWVSALMREDLPTLGRPIMASLRAGGGRRARGFRAGGSGFLGEERDRGIHQGADAALVDGADGEILREAQFGFRLSAAASDSAIPRFGS